LAQRQRERGVELYPSVMPALQPWAQKLGVTLPKPAPPAVLTESPDRH
jgi:hypothetical protein